MTGWPSEYRRAAALIDADTAAVAEMLAAQAGRLPVSAQPAARRSPTARCRQHRRRAVGADRTPRHRRSRRRCSRYLQRLAAFLAPSSVDVAENALRQFARWLIADTGAGRVAAVRRDDIEDYKVWLAAQPGTRAAGRSRAETHRQRLRMRALVLRADHRVGLARRAAPQPDHRRGHPEEARTAAEVPRRPRRRQAHGRRPRQHRPARPARRRAAGPHRDARRRAGRPRRRRGRADRRQPLAAHPARQAPQRPLRPAAPRSSSTCSPTGPPPTSSTSARHRRLVADHRGPLDRHLDRPHRRTASAAPPASTACTRTGCATPSPPRPSTAACGSKPSPRCSATARWR